jgi:hypothetical protein
VNAQWTRYECPRCHHWVDLRVTPKVPPTCACHPAKKVTVMQLVPR